MNILLASSNPHKLDEIQAIWTQCQQAGETLEVPLVLLDHLDPQHRVSPPDEDQLTFEANAQLKARYYASAFGVPTIADDSGLEVDALNGQPGVRSARYAGVCGPRDRVDSANNDRLMDQLGDTPPHERTARFVCAMAFCVPGGEPAGALSTDATAVTGGVRVVATVRGTIQGRVIGPDEKPRGENGFGYDPLFFVPSLGKTSAQLSPVQKNAISHRGRAAALMWQQLRSFLNNRSAATTDGRSG